MKKITTFLSLLIAFTLVLGLSASASAASPRPQRGDVIGATPDTYNAGWVTGVSQDGGAKGQSIILGNDSNDTTDFAYYSFRNWWDQDLSKVTKIQASFKAATGTVNSGGSPRFSLELSNGVVVYLDPAHCSVVAGSGWEFADFTGAVSDCTIYDSTGASYTSDLAGTAWSKVVSAYPGVTVYFLYLIQDATAGANYVDRIKLDNAFFTKQP